MITVIKKKSIFFLSLAAFMLTGAAAGEGESAYDKLRKENAQLRSQLIKQNAELSRMRLWLAGMVSGEAEITPEQKILLLTRFKEVVGKGKNLALKAGDITRELRALLAVLKLDDASRIRYTMLLDELDRMTQEYFGVVAEKEGKTLDLRVISLDSKLHIAVVSGGLREGIFPGMMLFPMGDKESKVRLRVIGVRSGACAVDLAAGEWSEVTPGMRVTPFKKER